MRTEISGMRRAVVMALAFGTAAWASAGQAQQVGTYSGTTADGNSLSFTVDIDPNTGAYEFTGAGIGFTAYCKKTNYDFNTAWGFGLAQDIVSGNNNIVVNPDQYNYFYLNYNLTFPDENTITGTVTSVTAATQPGNPPRRAVFCKAPTNQPLTATFQGTGKFHPPAVGTIVHYDKFPLSSK